MSLRIAPSPSFDTSVCNTRSQTSSGAPSAPGLHDTLRSRLSLAEPSPSHNQASASASPSAPLQSSHPLEARLKKWQATQEQLKMNLLRREFGIGEPVRRGMEMKICREAEWRPACLGGSHGTGEDILAGRDAEISWEDVYREDLTSGPSEGELQAEIDARVGLGNR